MSRNLSGQFTFAINNCFSEHVDKHDYKAEDGREMGNKIFSYSEKFRLKETGKMLQNYFRENGINVKEIKDIRAEHIQSFLSSKADTCTQNTINTYANSIYKLQNVVNATYRDCNVTWKQEVAIPMADRQKSEDRGVGAAMSRQDYNTILAYAKENPSQSGYAIQLQDFLGIRVQELPRINREDVNLEKGTITIEGKGGRVITKEIPADKIPLVKEILDKNFDNTKILSIDGDSINRQLGRIQAKLGLEKHSNHDIRRLIAQEKYDKYREQGLSIKDAANKTSNWLSHGHGRNDMLEKSYIVLR